MFRHTPGLTHGHRITYRHARTITLPDSVEYPDKPQICISPCQCHMGQMSESFDIPLPPGHVQLYSLAGNIHSTVERVPARPKDTVARSNLHLDLPVSQSSDFGAFWD